jgi:hypothetical protein
VRARLCVTNTGDTWWLRCRHGPPTAHSTITERSSTRRSFRARSSPRRRCAATSWRGSRRSAGSPTSGRPQFTRFRHSFGSSPDGRRQPRGHARPQGPGDDADLRDGAAGAPPNRDWEAERLLPSANSDDASLKMRHSRGSPRDRRPEIVDGWEFREGLERKTAGPSVLPDEINRISAGIVVYFAHRELRARSPRFRATNLCGSHHGLLSWHAVRAAKRATRSASATDPSIARNANVLQEKSSKHVAMIVRHRRVLFGQKGDHA